MDSYSIGGLSWSPDDRKLIFTSNRTGIANIYVIPSGGGDAVPLTHSTKETVRAIGYFPEDERILFSSDQGGNELAHIYVRERDGTTRDVTPGDRHVARFVDWARSEEHTSELQSLMRISYAVFCLKKKTQYRLIIKQA